MIYWQPRVVHDLPLDRHAVIEASAGTGKTYTIAHLTAAMLLGGTGLEQILSVTFTEKATLELRTRIRALLEQLCYGAETSELPDSVAMEIGPAQRERLQTALMGFERAPIFTIHGFCQRVLSEFAFDCGISFDLEVTDARLSFHRAFRAALRQELARRESPRALLEKWLNPDSEGGNDSDSRMESLEHLLFAAHFHRYSPQPPGASSPKRAIVDAFLPAVTERMEFDKRRYGEVDYDDMLAWVWRALDGPRGQHLAAALRQRYRFALVDEFQDTDDLQWRIFRRLFVESPDGNRLFVVGDPKQAIYGFRGADVYTYLQARQELTGSGSAPVKLTQNYRSTSGVVAACNEIFGSGAGVLKGEILYDTRAICALPERKLMAADDSPAASVILMTHGGGREKARAPQVKAMLGQWIAETLYGLLNRDADRLRIAEADGSTRAVSARDIFILTRSRAESAEIGGYLRAAGVPFAFFKQDGLFQSHEARFILDMLRAIEAPEHRSRRLRAWLSPFFGLAFRDLLTLGEPPAASPLNERLYQWRAMADAERFSELFSSLLYHSGLADRLLFGSDSEQELANYQHIFDVLLAQALTRRLSLAEVSALMADYVANRAAPPGENGNIQRMPAQRDAVQVMTIHASKGLEAEIVVLYGGLFRGNGVQEQVAVYHDGYQRRFAFGDERKEAPARVRLKQEEDEEERRLLYVALTRARVRLYLPLISDGSTRMKPSGYYAPLNLRLGEILKDLSGSGQRQQELGRIFAVDALPPQPQETQPASTLDTALSTWSPPPALLDAANDRRPPGYFERLQRGHAPLAMWSYTQLRTAAGSEAWSVSPEDFKGDVQAADEPSDLPGGRAVGIMLHEILERVDLEVLNAAPGLESWKNRPEVRALVRDSARRQRVREPQWLERAPELVYRALASRLVLPGGGQLGPLCAARTVREMEFVFPIPEAGHWLFARNGGGWRVERGYFKGFIDLVFEQDGKFYFADWKSDQLRSYAPAHLPAHVDLHYKLQARIYTTGVLRWLGVRNQTDYEARFGGLLYLFVRGLGPDSSDGVYFHRPDWAEVCRGEAELMKPWGEQVSNANG